MLPNAASRKLYAAIYTACVMVNESMVDLFHLENCGIAELKSVLTLYTPTSSAIEDIYTQYDPALDSGETDFFFSSL